MKGEDVVDLWEGEDETEDIWAGEEEGERTEDVTKVTGGTTGLCQSSVHVFDQVHIETRQHQNAYTTPLQTPIDLPFPVPPHPYYFHHGFLPPTTFPNHSLSDNVVYIPPHSQLTWTCLPTPPYPPYTCSYSYGHTVTPHIQTYRDAPQLQSDSLLPQLTPQYATHMHTFANTYTHAAPTHAAHITRQNL